MLKPDRPQHGHAAVCVIAQECSSATFVSLRFYLHEENSARFSKTFCNLSFFTILGIV
jgi:hypothetical protein